VLDANLTLSEAGDGRAVLRFAGVYRPPLAGAGEELDQFVLRRAASATVRSLLTRLARMMAEPESEVIRWHVPAPDTNSGGHPA
jgi:hypothetical protein